MAGSSRHTVILWAGEISARTTARYNYLQYRTCRQDLSVRHTCHDKVSPEIVGWTAHAPGTEPVRTYIRTVGTVRVLPGTRNSLQQGETKHTEGQKGKWRALRRRSSLPFCCLSHFRSVQHSTLAVIAFKVFLYLHLSVTGNNIISLLLRFVFSPYVW